MKFDASGNKVWENAFGGSGADTAYAIVRSPDGGFLVGGYATSDPSGNKTSPHYGGEDYWVVKMDANGNKLWDNSYGGALDERITSIALAGDGGYLLGGRSRSPVSGNKTAPVYGLDDYWLVKIDAAGNKLWDISFGGTSEDSLSKIVSRNDGTFLLGGSSTSGIGGTKTVPAYLGDNDYWVLQIDSAGKEVWERTFGGDVSEILYSLAPIADGGAVLLVGTRQPRTME